MFIWNLFSCILLLHSIIKIHPYTYYKVELYDIHMLKVGPTVYKEALDNFTLK
jgi:hypothetical protein